MSFDDFLTWAKLREIIPDDSQPYLRECFEYAQNQGGVISYYLAPFQLKTYVYCLAMHLIILSPNDANSDLHSKYFPNGIDFVGLVSNSVSNGTSSVGTHAYKGLNDLSLNDAMLVSTPYGKEVASMQNSLKVGIVVV